MPPASPHRVLRALLPVLTACGPIAGVPLGGAGSPTGGESSTAATTTSAGWQDGSSGADGCGLPTLDDLTLGQAYIDAGPFPDVARGTTRQLRLATALTGVTVPVSACVAWSMSPSHGAAITDDGRVMVEPATAVGTTYLVTADIEDGRRILELEVMVYEPVVTPILGFWSETFRTACDGTGPFLPALPVGELVFLDNSDFKVTWTPFESYVDYWGTFSHAPESGALTLTISGGNETPADFDGVGTALVTPDGALELHDMFLGSAPGRNPAPGCGHVFE